MAEDINEHIGKIIKQKRQAQNLSQAKLGDLVNYSQTEISKFERGKRELTASALFSISRSLNCSVKDFEPEDIYFASELPSTSSDLDPFDY